MSSDFKVSLFPYRVLYNAYNYPPRLVRAQFRLVSPNFNRIQKHFNLLTMRDMPMLLLPMAKSYQFWTAACNLLTMQDLPAMRIPYRATHRWEEGGRSNASAAASAAVREMTSPLRLAA